MKQLLLIFLLAGLFYARSSAQVSVNNDGIAPDNSAMLDVKSSNKGLLIPRVSLTGTLDATTIPSPVISLLIYNTATAGTPPNDVTPGYYYWNGSAWTRLSVSSGGSGGWSLLGNAGTTAGTNYIGTTDNKDVVFKTSGVESGRIGWNSYNTSFGKEALFSNPGGGANSAFGTGALSFNTSGNDNTAMGFVSLKSNTNGTFNTAMGTWSLNNNTTGNRNTAIGSGADVLSGDLTNATAIGANAKVGQSNSLVLGGTGTYSVNVGIGTTSPAASAALDVTSTTKGFLPPRMISLNRDAITNPSQGLVIYCTNCGANGELQVFNGTAWTNMVGGSATPVLTIGDAYQGGKIAYIWQPGEPGYVAGEFHGLIAAVSDQSTGAAWGCIGTEIGAYNSGSQNTIDIMAGCPTPGIAARICGDLVQGGYSDWYLPSINELVKLYFNRGAIGGFGGNYYWSSSEIDADNAIAFDFFEGFPEYSRKDDGSNVRAVRAF